MNVSARILTSLVIVVIHTSGAPNPTIDPADQVLCLSFEEAEARGLDIAALREEHVASVVAFPGQKSEIASAWSELQYALRDRLERSDLIDLDGSSMFSVVLFKPDGRIVGFFHRGLEPDQEAALCEVVERLAEEYRFPLTSSTRFSQCGTTHFKEN